MARNKGPVQKVGKTSRSVRAAVVSITTQDHLVVALGNCAGSRQRNKNQVPIGQEVPGVVWVANIRGCGQGFCSSDQRTRKEGAEAPEVHHREVQPNPGSQHPGRFQLPTGPLAVVVSDDPNLPTP
jgi:hypothetical protein